MEYERVKQSQIAAVVAVALTLVIAAPAAAQPVVAGGDLDEGKVAHDTEQPTIEWPEYAEEFRAWEYPLTGGLLAAGFYGRYGASPPEQNVDGPWLFDESVMDVIAVEDPDRQSQYDLLSEIPFYGSMAYRMFDDLVIAGALHDNWGAASQMFLIDLQASAIVAGVLWTSQLAVSRPRPQAAWCGTERDEVSSYCDEGAQRNENRSFIAGHPALVTAMAGTTCLHHQHMDLYGGGWGDTAACASMLGLAAATGYVRVAAGKHYPTDLLMGYGLGALAGYVVPAALHYGFSGPDDYESDVIAAEDRDGASGLRLGLAPTMMEGERPGMMMLGTF